MANFVVDPAPFVPEGLEIEDWARPARSRIVINGNPPRRHDEYAIVSLVPPPPPNHLHDAMEEVATFLEEDQHVVIRSCFLSPLGLCLVQFSSSLERQVMISRSPMQLDEMREIEIVEHDKGINFRSCPFTRTCWVLFLAFPLDFQTREIITQAVCLFGSVINWIDNSRCRSRLVLRCKVTLVSKIPISIVISEGNPLGDHGNSWTVPVFVLNSVQNDFMAGDEDPIPGNGNPHPEHPQQNAANGNVNQFPGIFEAVQDLDEVHQENVNQGWELPPPPPPQVNLGGWVQWPEPQIEEIDENEVNLVKNLADAAVANAVANGLMQHLEVPQYSHSISSDVQAVFKLKMPLSPLSFLFLMILLQAELSQ
jgi:hypothetical protein